MKTLTELLRAEFPDPEIYSRDDAVAEIVGLVQEWLGQQEIVDVLDFRQHPSAILRDQLQRMAGQK